MNRFPGKPVLIVISLLALSGCVERKTLRFVSRASEAPAEAVSPRALTIAAATDSAALYEIAPGEALADAASDQLLEVHFIDVGQGDCTLIICPNGSRILIDAGSTTPNFDQSAMHDYLLSKLDHDAPRVDALVITHPDTDHYDLLPTVLDGVDIGHIYTSGHMNEHTAAGVLTWLEAFDPADRTRLAATTYNVAPAKTLGDFGEVQVLVLASNVTDTTVNSEKNTHSVVLKVTYGTVDFMLTGDATRDTENSIMERFDPAFLEVEVLKLGHHGSDATSTSAEWAAVVSPEIAVASAGKNNPHGHPHRKVIGRIEPFTAVAEPHKFRWSWRVGSDAMFEDFADYSEAVYSTAVNGNIVITTDGVTMELSHDE